MPSTISPASISRSPLSTSVVLSKGVSRLEATLKLTTAILALAAGVYTYLGVRELLNGSPTTVFFAAVIYSVAVSVGIYAFWIFLMQFMPHVTGRGGRGLMFGCMLLGSLMIVAMSSWLNASALAGAAAVQQHLAITVQNYTRDLDTANTNAIAAQGLLPDIQLASSRFAKLADAERAGSLTGTAGSGTVVQLLTQMSGQLDGLGQEVQASGKRVSALYEQGGKNLAKMRELISDRGPISARSDAFASESLALMGVIANLQQTSVAPAVKRAATSLSSGFIAPAAGGRSGDLAERQTAVVGKVESSIAAQATSLSDAADKILAMPRVEPARFQSLTPAEAVLRYASDFIPSWAGAISIDLMPAVLVLILCVVHAAIRREGLPAMSGSDMTAGELVAALQMAREVEEARRTVPNETKDIPEPPSEPAPAEENVTSLSSARHPK
ncbi:hypothetical protein JQ634_28530 [Bradyrhizobium sp. AUGA SZCCT0240]|jgi:hypothetical protein|uniref:hypothetical protein n=1 Tax=unclassified Bradyrhizobium TaxID=2631580 RepID=UPI001BA72900|nr:MULTISPECIES: hypothetical protein [unclassified Bradyrhizobium]MBR1188785.1 hypothetical protein [Bradyrhizobium sp. AUGA SZCCT0160]MBR1201026.1 hypothetical protein [Bradyrhizobium sp. AUGA SZCCT0158]MBR1242703.1 hypothetical protein [Bradyrhizobium sp. AUGA SZCCT0274]MBR1251894.1 hypothetical protein [Bradyrhizobium sp. AUGA SZCCT0169]MBR1257622.1 hypothetical protein [Bradyrhizobium sp. AUGA SZCCT0240]